MYAMKPCTTTTIYSRADPVTDKSGGSLELVVKTLVQLVIILFDIIFVHKVITYVPIYSGFKYENLCLTHVVLAFLIIDFGSQVTKLIARRIREFEVFSQKERRRKSILTF